MSLVNDMLNDLEARSADNPAQNLEQWFAGRSESGVSKVKQYFWVVTTILLTLLAVALWQLLTKPADNTVDNIAAAAIEVQDTPAPANVVDTIIRSELNDIRVADEEGVVSVSLNAPRDTAYAVNRIQNGLVIKLNNVIPLLNNSQPIETVTPVNAIVVDELNGNTEVTLTVAGDFRYEVSRYLGDYPEIVIKIKSVEKSEQLVSPLLDDTAVQNKQPERNHINHSVQSDSSQHQTVKQVVSLSPEKKDRQMAQRASKLIAERRYASAEKILSEFLQRQTQAPYSAETLIALFLSQHRLNEAEPLLSEFRKSYPDNLHLTIMQARLSLLKGKADKAVELLRQAAPAMQTSTDYYQLLAQSAQRAQQYALAEQTYRQLLDIDRRRGDWWAGLAIALDAQGQTQLAKQAYKKALAGTRITAALKQYALQRLSAR